MRLQHYGWAVVCLLFAGLNAYGATFREARFLRGPSDNVCGTSREVTAFNTRDTEIWAFFWVNNGEAGGQAKMEWLSPNGQVVRTSAFNRAPNLANWCYTFDLSSAGNPYEAALGTWTARFTWTDPAGNVTVNNTIQVPISQTPPPATTLGAAQITTTDTPGSCVRTPEKTQFLTTDRTARLWFSYPSIPGRTRLKVAFAGPNGLSYSEYFGTVAYDGDWCFWRDLDFSAIPAPALPGLWNVRASLDDVEAFSRSFTVAVPGLQATLPQTSASPAAAGGAFTVSFTASGAWSVVVNVPWITITSPASGSGNGTVAYTIAANPTATARVGIITIAGQTFTVTQAGTPADPGLQAGATAQALNTDFVYDNFAATAGLQFTGSAAAASTSDGRVLRLVAARTFDGGNAFARVPVSSAAFSTSFAFRYSQAGGLDGGADGLVFILQADGPLARGAGPGMAGFQNLPVSVGVEFDIWRNPQDPNNSHVAVLTNGDITAHRALANTPTPMLDGAVRYVWIDYDGTNLEVRLNTANSRPESPLLRYAINIPATLRSNIAYVGFSGGTGAGFANHDVLRWQFASASPGTRLVNSDWEAAANGVDGWTFRNDGTNLTRVTAGGNPGAFLRVTDQNRGDTVYFAAPAKFLGNQAQAYGGALLFDLQQDRLSSQFNDNDVILTGGGLTLVFDTPANPVLSPAWLSYSVPLTAAAGWRVNSLSGAPATEAQLRTVLGNLGSLLIRAEYSNEVDTNGIDNVTLLSGQSPSSVVVSGVTNAADFSPTVAPGSLATLFGSGLASGTASPASLPLGSSLQGVSVSVNGRNAPITFLSPSQINFQVPVETPVGTAAVVVTNSQQSTQQTSAPVDFNVASAAPGIFQYGTNRGVVVNQDGALNTAAAPAAGGSTVVAYLTGIGVTRPSVADGAPSPGGPLAVPPGAFSATIGGFDAPVVFLGLSPGFVGLAQANLQIPSPLSTGDFPLVITVNGRASRPATITVRGTGTASGGGGGTVTPLPAGSKCVSGTVDSVTFSLANRASRLADEVSIGGVKLCATCEYKQPLYGNFVDKLEAARTDGLSVDACYDSFGTMTYLRLRP